VTVVTLQGICKVHLQGVLVLEREGTDHHLEIVGRRLGIAGHHPEMEGHHLGTGHHHGMLDHHKSDVIHLTFNQYHPQLPDSFLHGTNELLLIEV
jgi:hypothetical protein